MSWTTRDWNSFCALLLYIYKNDRCEFLKCIEAIDPTIKYLQDEAKFEYLMTSQNVSIIKHVMRYIFKSLKLRKEKLGKHWYKFMY